MTMKIGYNVFDSGEEQIYEITSIKAISSQHLPDEYIFGKGYTRKMKTHCMWIEGEDTLVVYDANQGAYIGEAGEGVLIGYRVGDMLTNDKFYEMVAVLNVCGDRLHRINQKKKMIGDMKLIERKELRI